MYCLSALSDWFSIFLLPQVIGFEESYCRKWLNLTAASDFYLTAASDWILLPQVMDHPSHILFLERKKPDICHILWHSFWHMYLAYLLTFFLAFYLVYPRRFFVVEVRRATLWSWACGGGPAGNALIRSLWWRSGGEHFDPEVAVGVRRGTPHLELAVEVRRGSLWSRGCCWGPAGNTAI